MAMGEIFGERCLGAFLAVTNVNNTFFHQMNPFYQSNMQISFRSLVIIKSD